MKPMLQRDPVKELVELTVNANNYDHLSERIVHMLHKLFGAELCTLWRLRPRRPGPAELELSASVGFHRRPGEASPTYRVNFEARNNSEIEGVTAWIAARGQICIANSLFQLTEDEERPWYGSHRGKWDTLQFRSGPTKGEFRSLLGLPVQYGATPSVIAVIKIENSCKKGGFDEADLELADRLLPFLSILLQGMVGREDHEKQRQVVLKELTAALPTLDLRDFHQRVVDRTARLLRADICSLWLVDHQKTKLVLGANYGVIKKDRVPEYPLNWDAQEDKDIDGLTPWVMIRRKPFFGSKYEDLQDHPAHKGKWDAQQWEGGAPSRFGALYALPLFQGDRSIGVFKIENSADKHVFDEIDRTTFEIVADFIGLAIELNSRLRPDIVFDFFHLLKTPTTNSVMAFEAVRRELAKAAPDSGRIRKYLDLTAKNLETVRIWTTNVYGLASAADEAKAQRPIHTSLFNLLTDIEVEVQRLFTDFDCDIDPSLEKFTLDLTPLQKKKVEVIFFNILNNSYKYSGDDKSIHVYAEQCEDEDGLSVLIEDNGRGISLGNIDRIFDPYYRETQQEWPESMGLGLATVAKLIKDLGWGRSIQSELGIGTKFRITLPKDGYNEQGASDAHAQGAGR